MLADDARAATRYPPPDNALSDFMYKTSWLKNPLEQKIRCAAFVAGVFTAALPVLQEGPIEPLAFRDRLTAEKVQFDAEAVRNATEIMATAVPPPQTL